MYTDWQRRNPQPWSAEVMPQLERIIELLEIERKNIGA